jgi:hypothetical protein
MRAAVCLASLAAVLTAAPVPAGAQGAPALAEAKFTAARKAYEAHWKALPTGLSDPEKVYLWSRRVLEAQRALSPKKADRVAAAEAHLERMRDLQKATVQRYKAGRNSFAEVAGTDFYLAEAQSGLAQAKAQE